MDRRILPSDILRSIVTLLSVVSSAIKGILSSRLNYKSPLWFIVVYKIAFDTSQDDVTLAKAHYDDF